MSRYYYTDTVRKELRTDSRNKPVHEMSLAEKRALAEQNCPGITNLLREDSRIDAEQVARERMIRRNALTWCGDDKAREKLFDLKVGAARAAKQK